MAVVENGGQNADGNLYKCEHRERHFTHPTTDQQAEVSTPLIWKNRSIYTRLNKM